MTRPVNIYNLSRIHEEDPFNIVERHHSQCKEIQRTQYHEIESLRLLTDELLKNDISIADLDGFFYSFQIPQIGKEFDLLKFTDKLCLNIELKSVSVPEEQILEQLLKNRHYLGHLGKRLRLYSIVTDTMTCYKLSLNDELIPVEFDEIVSSIKRIAAEYSDTIDNLFRASDYLVSPLNTPAQFIQGEYFLTQAQEQIKKNILSGIDAAFFGAFFHLTGKPGTGKTLLIYDLAKTLSRNGKTLIIHCGKLSSGQYKIRKEIEQLYIISAGQLRNDDVSLADYNYILVDETHRIYTSQFEAICDSVRTNDQVCIFSSDPEQILSNAEKRNDIVNKIKAIPPDAEYTLSEKIRTNKELHSFILCMKNLNHRARVPMDYSSVELNYANTTQEAQSMLEYYRNKGYTFINIDIHERILRKGAIAAHKGERVLIPINMRDGSVLAVGKGNPDWNCSAPHGAGRILSRKAAKEGLSMEEYRREMAGVYTTSVNEVTLDEAPMAYKSLADIIDVIAESVDIVEVLRPIYNFKAN